MCDLSRVTSGVRSWAICQSRVTLRGGGDGGVCFCEGKGGYELVEAYFRKWFGEQVSGVVVGGYMMGGDEMLFDVIL